MIKFSEETQSDVSIQEVLYLRYKAVNSIADAAIDRLKALTIFTESDTYYAVKDCIGESMEEYFEDEYLGKLSSGQLEFLGLSLKSLLIELNMNIESKL